MIIEHRQAGVLARLARRAVRNVTPVGLRNSIARAPQWAIGVCESDQPLAFPPDAARTDPILTVADVSDVPAAFVADPFAVRREGTWFLYFEAMNQASGKGEIGLATSEDSRSWSYQGITLAEPFHLSYPYVFEWDGAVYMVPEAGQSGEVRLYRASHFPEGWTLVQVLLKEPHLDPTIFRHGGSWWMFSEMSPRNTHDRMFLHHAPRLEGPWLPHPLSPLVKGDPTAARPAGRVVAHRGRLVRYAQDCAQRYGLRAHAFEIEELTPTTYFEQRIASPVIGPGRYLWNKHGMHHVDPHDVDGRWIAFVDGY